MGRWVFSVCKWKFYSQICIPRCFSGLWGWICDTARQTCFGCQETILSLLKTTFSFPCGRQHSPQCSAAVGVLSFLCSPLLELICPCGWCPFSLTFPALWILFLSILLSHSFSTNKDVLQHIWRTGKEEHILWCWKSLLVLPPFQFSKYFSLCHLSLFICQRTILKYFLLYINLVSSMTYFCIHNVKMAALRVQEIPVTLMHSN